MLCEKQKLDKAVDEVDEKKGAKGILLRTFCSINDWIGAGLMMHELVKSGLMEQSSFLSGDGADAEEGEGPEFVAFSGRRGVGKGNCTQLAGITSNAASSAASASGSHIASSSSLGQNRSC